MYGYDVHEAIFLNCEIYDPIGQELGPFGKANYTT